MADDLVLGIDAGATRIRAALANLRGAVLARGEGGAGNALSVPADDLARNLREALGGVVTRETTVVRAVVAGFAGAAPPEVDPADTGRERARAALVRACADVGIVPGGIDVRSDAEVAYASGAGPLPDGLVPDGLVLICGSGAFGARIRGGRLVQTADGHGRLIDDAGSAFWIGRYGMRAALRCLDGRGPRTVLADTVAARLGVAVAERGIERIATRRALIRAVYARDEFYLSTLCPLVTGAASEGDAVANAILDEAVAELAVTVGALDPVPGEPLVTTGALLAPDGPLLPRLRRAMAPLGLVPNPVANGLAGAVTLARAALGALAVE